MIRVVSHIVANIVFPGVGSAVVEAFFALKAGIKITKELANIAILYNRYDVDKPKKSYWQEVGFTGVKFILGRL